MAKRDPRVDTYIAKAAPFAQPVLKYLRELVHEVCPDTEETLKWSMPSFLHGGRILCGIAAFKQHCSFWFWRGMNLSDADGRDGMGAFGRITSRKDLPSKKALVAHLKKAIEFCEAGAKFARPHAAPKPPPEAPEDLLAALKKNRKACNTYESFGPGAKREYVEWICEAKRDATRAKRLAQAVEWMAEGKQRNWKYMNC